MHPFPCKNKKLLPVAKYDPYFVPKFVIRILIGRRLSVACFVEIFTV